MPPIEVPGPALLGQHIFEKMLDKPAGENPESLGWGYARDQKDRPLYLVAVALGEANASQFDRYCNRMWPGMRPVEDDTGRMLHSLVFNEPVQHESAERPSPGGGAQRAARAALVAMPFRGLGWEMAKDRNGNPCWTVVVVLGRTNVSIYDRALRDLKPHMPEPAMPG